MSFIIWPWLSKTKLQFSLVAMVLLAMLALTVADATAIWNARQETIESARLETTNLARSLADDVDGDFTTLDTMLLSLRERVLHDGTGPEALRRLRGFLKSSIAALPMIHSMLILGADGRLLVSGDGVLTPGMSMAKSATFQHHLGSTSLDMFVGPPIRNILDGRWVIKLSRRVNNADGSLAAIVIDCVTTDFFEHLFNSFDVGQHGVIAMANHDGLGVARSPAVADFVGRDFSKAFLFKTGLLSLQQADFESTSMVDGRTRFNSFHQIQGTPLFVAVGRDKQDVLAGWRRTALLHLLALSLVLILIYDLGRRLALRMAESEGARGLLEKTVSRLTASEAQLTTANRRLAMAEHIAQVGHWHVDLQKGNAVTWSDQVYRIHGRDPAKFVPGLQTGINAYHPDDRARVEAAISETIRTGLPFQVDLRLVRNDGVIRHVKARGVRQDDMFGQPSIVFGVFMDVTDQKQAEQLLQRAQKDAEAANKALAVANHALETMAMQDSLTGLSNRRHFDVILDQEVGELRRTHGSLALILIDIDRFKQYNDFYGHPAGDACLRLIAQTIRGFANRAGDIACRYGGEEMALLLPHCNENAAMTIAEDVVCAIRHLAIQHTGSERGLVTISAGVAVLGSERPIYTPSDLVGWADEALYAAKRGGRDCVLAYSSIQTSIAEDSREFEHCERQSEAA